MKLYRRGKNTLNVEVSNISMHGIWLYVNGKEYFLPYDEYPWFKDAKIKEIHNVQLLHESSLHWPELDVDLELDSLEHPEKYPLFFHRPDIEQQP